MFQEFSCNLLQTTATEWKEKTKVGREHKQQKEKTTKTKTSKTKINKQICLKKLYNTFNTINA